jgi:hypothetical protein
MAVASNLVPFVAPFPALFLRLARHNNDLAVLVDFDARNFASGRACGLDRRHQIALPKCASAACHQAASPW